MPEIENEMQKLLSKGAIVDSHHEEGEYISPIFSVPKNDGSTLLILNLKKFNEFVKFTHFQDGKYPYNFKPGYTWLLDGLH